MLSSTVEGDEMNEDMDVHCRSFDMDKYNESNKPLAEEMTVSDDKPTGIDKLSEYQASNQNNASPSTSKNNEESTQIKDRVTGCLTTPCRSTSPLSEQEEEVWLGTHNKKLKLCTEKMMNKMDSENHWILFEGSFDGISPPLPFKQPYFDRWDSHHVRLPCSAKNLYVVENSQDNSQSLKSELTCRWEMIQTSLLSDMTSSIDIEEAILTYNSRYSEQWAFKSLHSFFTEVCNSSFKHKFFTTVLPKMVTLALQLPTLFPKPIPLLSQHRNGKITMTQQQVACLLCNAFFCTFPRRNSRHKNSEYTNFPLINFNGIFQGIQKTKRQNSHMEKIRTLLHYFDRITDKIPVGTITYERRSFTNFPNWSESDKKLRGFHVTCKGMIEDARGMLQVDFANKFIGGGVLRSGLVQEEIRFCVCPELIASMLFMEKLDDNECIFITGCEQYSSFTGYADTYQWVGDYVDMTTRDQWGRRMTNVVAMDATRFVRSAEQYTIPNLQRELNKAYCGFFCQNPDGAPAIATGNWGCGAFGGNPHFKCLLQLMAAAEVGRDICYFTFNDPALMKELHAIWNFITEKNLNISDLWHYICNYHKDNVVQRGKKIHIKSSIFEYIKQSYHDYHQSTDEEM